MPTGPAEAPLPDAPAEIGQPSDVPTEAPRDAAPPALEGFRSGIGDRISGACRGDLRIRRPRSGRRPTSRSKRRRKSLKRRKPHPPRTKPSRSGGSRELPIRASRSPIIARRDGGFRRPILSALRCNPPRAPQRRGRPRRDPRRERRPENRAPGDGRETRARGRPEDLGFAQDARSPTRDATAGRRRAARVRAGREGR